MKKVLIEIEVPDNFEKWNCDSCPISVWSDSHEGNVCSYASDDCPIITSDTMSTIKTLEEKIKNLEKSNRNWHRKCQRLRNKVEEKNDNS